MKKKRPQEVNLKDGAILNHNIGKNQMRHVLNTDGGSTSPEAQIVVKVNDRDSIYLEVSQGAFRFSIMLESGDAFMLGDWLQDAAIVVVEKEEAEQDAP